MKQVYLGWKNFLAGAVLASVSAAPALADHRNPAGEYQGTCYARYSGTNAAPCAMTLYLDFRGRITIPGDQNCISPTSFFGQLHGYQASLRAPGWNAQPQGQTLDLVFQRQGYGWAASGSGRGISDGKWTYSCNFYRP